MFTKTTRDIVSGKRKATPRPSMPLDDVNGVTEELTPEASPFLKVEAASAEEENPRRFRFSLLQKKLSLPLWGLIAAACGVFFLGELFMFLLLRPGSGDGSTLAIPEGQTAIPVAVGQALTGQASAGDILRLYNAQGQPIPELQYVQCIGTAEEELLLLMDEKQAAAYITGFGGTASLVLHGQRSEADRLLELQAKIIAPELELNMLKRIQIRPGESKELNCILTSDPAEAILPPVTWTSSEEAVAAVDENGVITGLAAGRAIITASCGDQAATCVVTVSIPLTGIGLNMTEVTIGTGATVELVAAPDPADATDFAPVWSVDNPAVATVDNGVVTAQAPGTAVVTVACGQVSASCTVTVGQNIEVLQVSPNVQSLQPGQTAGLTYSVYPADAMTEPPAWSSSDEGVATVTGEGVVTAVGPGSAIITVTCGAHSDTCVVTVTAPE